MNTLSLTTTLLTHSLAWALLYSLWQGLLIYAIMFVLLRAMPGISSRVRYYISFASFAGMVAWFADTWITQYQKLRGITVYITHPGPDATSVTYTAHTISSAQLQSPVVHHLLPRIEQYFPAIMFIYTIGLSFMLFRFVVNIMQVGALRTRDVMHPDAYWTEFISRWQEQFRISRRVRLFFSTRVNTPMMLGIIKPIILLPVATMNHLSTEQVEAILLHELAHIKRHDYLLNILQTIVETILFFNPFVWLISSSIRREREHCCDDIVISCNASPLSYVKALAILEDNRVNANQLALAATGHKNQLFHRIKRIMEMKRNNINYTQLTIIVITIAAITFAIAMFTFTPSYAQKAKKESAKADSDTTAAPQKKTVYKYKKVTVDKNGKRTETVKESSSPIKEEDMERERNKAGGDEDDDVNVNVVVNGGHGSSNSSGSAHSYSYSYSYDFSKDMKDMIDDVITITKDAMDNVNLDDLQKEMENARKEMNINWREVRDEIDKGIDEVDKELNSPQMRKEINIKVRKHLQDTKDALQRTKEEMERNRRTRVRAYAGNGRSANVTIVTNGDDDDIPAPPTPPALPSAAVPPAPPAPPAPPTPPIPSTSGNMEHMLAKMEREGLIDRSKNYKIEKDGNTLYINEAQQPADVLKRYSDYLDAEHINIKGHKGHLSISITD